MTHRIEYRDVEAEILFRAMDRPDDIKKLLSLQATGGWVNEAREIPRIIFSRLAERVGRYPPQRDGGPTWHGIIGDTNPADDDHWLTEAERKPPQGWEFFVQPPGLLRDGDGWRTNPEAENLHHLPRGYYEINLEFMRPDEINVFRANLPGFVIDGKPVIPEFNANAHAVDHLPADDDLQLTIGVDVGGGTLNPSATYNQRHPRGTRLVLGETVCEDVGVERFSEELMADLARWFPGHLERLASAKDDEEPAIVGYGDPAGNKRDEVFERAIFDHLKARTGIRWKAAPTQDTDLRRDAIRAPLSRMVDGKPGMLIHKGRCPKLVRGLSGGWSYKRKPVSGREEFASVPNKGPYSHVCEALGYNLVSTGELRTLKRADAKPREDAPVNARRSVMERSTRANRLGWIR